MKNNEYEWTVAERKQVLRELRDIAQRLERIVKQMRVAADYIDNGNESFGCRMVAHSYDKFCAVAEEVMADGIGGDKIMGV